MTVQTQVSPRCKTRRIKYKLQTQDSDAMLHYAITSIKDNRGRPKYVQANTTEVKDPALF